MYETTVLIPFRTGLSFEPGTASLVCDEAHVLIPFRTGLSFEQKHDYQTVVVDRS